MSVAPSPDHQLILTVADSWDRIVTRLEQGLSHITGMSFADYRLLRAIGDAPRGEASRVDLAARVGLTPSGVTRALRPLEKLGFVETRRDERDARRALARLTPAGQELLANATGVVDDVAAQLLERAPTVARDRERFTALLGELAAG